MLTKKQIQEIDVKRFEWDTPYPKAITINECYISSVLCNNPDKIWYSVELVVVNDSKMMNIIVEMSQDELKSILKKSTNFSFERWMATTFLLSINFREVFESYVHCIGCELTVKARQNDKDNKGDNNNYEISNWEK